MATEGSDAARAPSLTSLPRFEDIPRVGDGLDTERAREVFDAYRRHVAQLQAQLRVLQVAGARTGGAAVEGTGHAVRMDALHLIRAAAEFADAVELDAQSASATQLARTEEEVSRRQRDLHEREAEIERYRQESERQRAEAVNTARREARELLAKASADATRELQEAEARGGRLLEQSRHQATELTNAARAEVEQTLEWARTQAGAILSRAQHGAEQLLAAAGLGSDALSQVATAIVNAAEASSAPPPPTAAFASGESPAAQKAAEPEPQAAEESEPAEIPEPPVSSFEPPVSEPADDDASGEPEE